MEEYKDNKITVTDCRGHSLTLTLSWDADIEAWTETFKTIMTFLTFHPNSIAEMFASDEINYDTKEE
jgi:hypothetical protein